MKFYKVLLTFFIGSNALGFISSTNFSLEIAQNHSKYQESYNSTFNIGLSKRFIFEQTHLEFGAKTLLDSPQSETFSNQDVNTKIKGIRLDTFFIHQATREFLPFFGIHYHSLKETFSNKKTKSLILTNKVKKMNFSIGAEFPNKIFIPYVALGASDGINNYSFAIGAKWIGVD